MLKTCYEFSANVTMITVPEAETGPGFDMEAMNHAQNIRQNSHVKHGM